MDSGVQTCDDDGGAFDFVVVGDVERGDVEEVVVDEEPLPDDGIVVDEVVDDEVDDVSRPEDGVVVLVDDVARPDDGIVVDDDEVEDELVGAADEVGVVEEGDEDDVDEDVAKSMADGNAELGASVAMTGEIATSPTNPTARATSERRYISTPICDVHNRPISTKLINFLTSNYNHSGMAQGNRQSRRLSPIRIQSQRPRARRRRPPAANRRAAAAQPADSGQTGTD